MEEQGQYLIIFITFKNAKYKNHRSVIFTQNIDLLESRFALIGMKELNF